ncbi:GNAT family N-acetyltransferase [Kitasatospora camelliae]|uniref:GNAT family N-acetyltransferase n=1 Tax=Kitasatospora camelliae TaxID=3156397 RepID=A0AAU8K5Q7_9ACTN
MNDRQRTDFAVKPVLTGESVVLRPFDLTEDTSAIRSWLTDPEVGRYTDPGNPVPPWDEDAERRMRARYGTRADQTDRLDLAITDRAAGRCVGEIVLKHSGGWRRPPAGRPGAAPGRRPAAAVRR